MCLRVTQKNFGIGILVVLFSSFSLPFSFQNLQKMSAENQHDKWITVEILYIKNAAE